MSPKSSQSPNLMIPEDKRSKETPEQKNLIIFETSGTRVTFTVEIAQTAAEHDRGLMYRKHLERDSGMLFIFSTEQNRRFWMKNTYLSLDLIFLNRTKEVVGIIENAKPLSTAPLFIDKKSTYVLEILGGMAGILKLQVGMKPIFLLKS